MQLHRETIMNFQVDAFDLMGNGTTFIGTEIFPAVLHSMLDEVEEKGYSHIVSWQPHGLCFVVHNRKDFVQFIMPAYFRMSKFASFQRQLNIYDYKRITAGPDKGGYYHEYFVKGRKGLCQYIVRQQLKGTLTRKPAPATEPDFYRLGTVHCANSENTQVGVGRRGDISRSACLSDTLMTAGFSESNTGTYFMPAPPRNNTLLTKAAFSNAHGNPSALGRQQYTKMSFGELQASNDQSLFAAMGSAPAMRSQQFYNGSLDPRFSHTTLLEAHTPELNCYNTDDDSIGTIVCPPRYAICEETKPITQVTNPDLEAYNCNQSVISMLAPFRYSRCDGNKRMLFMNNCKDPQLMANDQPFKAYHRDFGSRIKPFSSSFFSGPTMDAPVIDEFFGPTNNHPSFNESRPL